MNESSIHYSNLLALSTADYTIANGGADITGWPLQTEGGELIGEVKDLLFDPVNNTIRYLVVALEKDISSIEKSVLIPIGIADLAATSDAVIVPDIDPEQLRAMPRYITGEVTHEMEDEIRAVIGSPAALRIEEEILEMDRGQFYNHHHFDRGNLNRIVQAQT